MASPPLRKRPDVVLVGYLAQFDVVLARVLFPRTILVLDLLVFADETATDRRVRADPNAVASPPGLDGDDLRQRRRTRYRGASCDAPAITTEQGRGSSSRRRKCVVHGANRYQSVEGDFEDRVLGLYTPLQGAPVIAAAVSRIPAEFRFELTMVGTGRDSKRSVHSWAKTRE